jgi:hypothetical protein
MTSTAVATSTFVAEYSYEATTLDYLSPLWYSYEGVEPFASKEEAEAFVAAKREAWYAKTQEPMAFRVREVKPPAPREYVDSDAEFNALYWRGQAEAARRQEEARREMFAAYGRGNVVKVVKGRKVPLGTEGEVFWLGDKGWGYSVGFKTAEGEKHFTSIRNVESVSPAYEAEES